MTLGADYLARGTGTAGSRGRSWTGPAVAVGLLVVLGLLTLRPADTGTAFDPTSPGPTGLAAVLDVLREVGIEVEVTDDPTLAAEADSVLVPPLGWPDEVVDQLASDGARVVAQVPPDDEAIASPLGVGGVGFVDLEADCALLADVGTLRTVSWPGWQASPGTEVIEACLVRDGTAWLTRVARGEGELVALSTMAPLTNERLVDSDAGLAAARLLAPTADTRVVVLGPPPGDAPPTLVDLIDRRWFDAAWLTLAVLAVLALARGRRLGRPVDEDLPVRVPSGELARAIGDLRHRAGHDAAAATVLRDRTLARVRSRFGLPSGMPADEVVAQLRAHGIDVDDVTAAALTGPLDDDPDRLVAVARTLAALRDRLTRTSST